MDVQQLRYFSAVARTGSFTKAAAQEQVSQPALSQQIHRLEAELGLPLFERLGRSVRLTENGQVLLPRVLAMLQELGAAKAEMESLLDGTQGELRIGCIPTIMPFYLAPRLPEFAARHPGVSLRLVEDTTARLIEKLQSGDLDLAVLALPVASPDLVCSELFREELMLALASGHAMAEAPAVNLKDLRGERMLLLKEGHCFRDNVLTACRRANFEFESVFESDQFASIFPLVAAGFGISLIPAMAAGQAGEKCKLLPLTKPSFRRVGYARARRHFAGKAEKAFVAWLREGV
jgi:LysR family hydrogen peroxide-inducible transcriptional activator